MRHLSTVLVDLSSAVLHSLWKEVSMLVAEPGGSEDGAGVLSGYRSDDDAGDLSGYRAGDVSPKDKWSEEWLRDQLADSLLDPSRLKKIYSSFSEYEKDVLTYFIFHVGDHFLTYRKLEDKPGQMKPNLFRLGLTGLRRKGLVYTLRRQWGEVAYFLPQDVAEKLYMIILEESGSAPVDHCTETVQLTTESMLPVYIDVFILLDDWRQRPQMQVPLTRKKTIHKRVLRFWEEKLTEREAALERLSLPVHSREAYSCHMAILLDFLTRNKIIRWSAENVTLDSVQARKWMSATREQMTGAFLEYWLGCHTPSAEWLQRYQKDMKMCFDRFRQRGRSEWIYLLSFVERWEEYYGLPPVKTLQAQIEEELLLPLAVLGLLECGQTEQGEKVWRFRRHEEQRADMWLQPDLELFAPEIIPFAQIWNLTEIFQLDNWESMLVFTLSQTRALHFLERGGAMDEWLRELEPALATPLPESLKDQLSTWQRKQEQVQVSDETVVEIRDPQMAEAFSKWTETQSLRLRRLTPNIFSVPVQQKEELYSVFQDHGFKVHKKEEPQATGEMEQEMEIQPALLRHTEDRDLSFKIESIFPDWTEAIPAWQQLPDMWTRNFGSYHEKTKRDILERAIEHDLVLKIEDQSGKIVHMKPADSAVEGGQWLAYDHRDRKYPLTDMKRMQLLFPEVDET